MKGCAVLIRWGMAGLAALVLLVPAPALGEDAAAALPGVAITEDLFANLSRLLSARENAPPPGADQVALAIARSAEDLREVDSRLLSAMKTETLLQDILDQITPDTPGNTALITRLVEAVRMVRADVRPGRNVLDGVGGRLEPIGALSPLRGSVMASDLAGARALVVRAHDLLRNTLDQEGDLLRLLEANPDSLPAEVYAQVGLAIAAIGRATGRARQRILAIEGPGGAWVNTFHLNELELTLQWVYANYACGGHWATIVGTSGDDVIQGTNGPDVIQGRAGNDLINGDDPGIGANGGDDIICGGDGDDEIHGWGGSDIIYGGAGNDILLGEFAGNVIYGGPGDDLISVTQIAFGGEGNDQIFAGEGDQNCIFLGEDGDDILVGGKGNDILSGGHGSDFLYGYEGNDYLFGGPSDGHLYRSFPQLIFTDGSVCGDVDWDFMWGGDGDDVILGEGGNDWIDGGPGKDVIYGGYQNDELSAADPDGRDCIWGGGGQDTVHAAQGNDFIEGGAGNDTLFGGDGDDLIAGMGGNDYISGGAGNDKLYGDGWCGDVTSPGNDQIFGDGGDDFLAGGPLTDTCDGESGTDSTDGSCETNISIP